MTSYRPSTTSALGVLSLPFTPLMSGYLNHVRPSARANARYRGSKYNRRYGKTSIPRRVQLLEQAYNAIRPELHYADYLATGVTVGPNSVKVENLTNISQGDFRSQRTGNRVRIHKVEIRSTSNSSSATFEEPLGQFLLLGKDARTPTIADFGGQLYPMVTADDFTELKSWSTKCNIQADSQTTRRVKYFKPPLEVHYETQVSTTAIVNRLYFCCVNNGASNATVNYVIRVYFTG